VFLGGKNLLGIALGMLNSTCQTYISEIAPPRIRGPLLSIFTFFLVLGQLIAITVVFSQIAVLAQSSYRVCFASQWSFVGFAILVGFLIPESPANLVKRGKLEQVERAYARLHSKEQAPTASAPNSQSVVVEEVLDYYYLST
jgi:SP family general alpha glucoside:H+ symporter-like MFS transporter